MVIQLKSVDQNNFDACVNLELKEGQEKFVTSNLFSIAQSKVYPECIPMVIYSDETIVGFIMFIVREGKYRVSRLMIDKNFQGKGLGKAAMLESVKFAKETYRAEELYTSFEPENKIAEQLYTSVGFIKIGEILDGEVVMKSVPNKE
jgi:diamine N-acetyltransferase